MKMPHDFKPILKNKKTGIESPFLSFGDIWDMLYAKMLRLINKDKKYFRFLAALLYNIAFMVHHVLEDKFNTEEVELKFDGDKISFGKSKPKTLENIYLYKPSENLIKELSKVFGDFDGMSLEAFLYYNDLLGWNEDCKYYYYGLKIHSGIGRINTILTHISVIGTILGEITLSSILTKATRTRGVAPINKKEAEKLLGEFIEKQGLYSSV